MSDGSIRAINEQKRKPYAAALKHDLYVFNHLKEGVQVENFLYEADGQFANGWMFTGKETSDRVYTIYLKGVYQFDIVEKEKGWTAVAEKVERRGEIDQKLANYAFKWATIPITAITRHKEEEEESAQQSKHHTIDKNIEFMLDFQFKGTPVIAFAVLQDTPPWKQCTVGIKTSDLKSPTDYFEFFKVDNKDQLFSWISYNGAKEKMAKAIAAALEQRFAVQNVFDAN